MKITAFNPLIITKDSESAIKLFEELGFTRRHKKVGIGPENITNIRMRDASGFHVDIAQTNGELMMIRMNVDNLEEAVELMTSYGLHKASHASMRGTFDTGSSRFEILVSLTGLIILVSQHIK